MDSTQLILQHLERIEQTLAELRDLHSTHGRSLAVLEAAQERAETVVADIEQRLREAERAMHGWRAVAALASLAGGALVTGLAKLVLQ